MYDVVTVIKDGGQQIAFVNLDKEYHKITLEQFDKIKSYIETLIIVKKGRRKKK